MKLLIVFVAFGLVFGQRNPYYGNLDDFVFDGPISSPRNRQIHSRSSDEGSDNPQTSLSSSISLAKQLNELDSLDDFLNILEGVPDSERNVQMASRFGGEERSSVSAIVSAMCKPELQPVPFKKDKNDRAVVYYPACTRIKRCGGCCGHPSLSCQPVTNETRNFEVHVAKVTGHNKMRYSHKEIVTLEEHTSCKCRCRIQAEHCTDKQQYVRDECRCRCRNSDEETKCTISNKTKLWDPDGCVCLCRNIQECNTGYYFDQNTCRCDDEKMIFL
ncbi:vascular endothelial growth factor A isoform X2 [Diachasma alloeum]|uniref:vascular endothelial growth factor A isoform X2 n=1 Tax=Diachasma alloeum TaxID=454923 RepID=UPI0007381327|nr:vascular endothelial growth factor A isoform X2 [Diachasma alloeum]